ncbi:3-ketoacyl-ACP reductase [Chryseobacterium piperi]|uniref:3-ketoacyl-ACP reductase n=1 Tax=Chryseobacterium piperi TaxID=558152 RepID=A0A086BCQ1_9FLAO|nr:SDR family oxidoreductase [Chryseobacterium piperi]ASW73532.1 NAD(P)-dependent oxidoreductase [Chryseobacterium piperi]KFF26715.1 3-ketoacyl-ACP reductase [Chryseobacterium piperi]
MKKLLENKTAVITGGSRGIGFATAKLFVEEGANVVITALDQKEIDEAIAEIVTSGGKAIGLVADSADPKTPKAVFSKAIETFGQVDILVNNAATNDLFSVEDTTDELFEKTTQVNYAGVFRYCREAIQHFIPRDSGVIINVSSTNGELPVSGLSYASTKGAMNTITKNIAIRFSGTGIRCNAVAPGLTISDMTKPWTEGTIEMGTVATKMATYDPLYTNQLAPMEAIDQANAILFLSSDMGKGVNGVILKVDLGSSM